jgi:hypothetical protein
MLTEPTAVVLKVIESLEFLGIPYLIGGSFASAIHGVARMTADVDLVAEMRLDQVEPFVDSLEDSFYVDAGAVREAILRRGSFNVIHLDTMFKVDVFISKERSYDRAQFDRREKTVIALDPERTAYVATGEDNILAKLEWYRLGNEISERQWADVTNVMKTQAGRLDLAYLRHWANVLGVADLLERALREALPNLEQP